MARRGITSRGRSGWLAAAALLATLVAAHAEGCDSATTQVDLDQCAGDAFKKADTALGATYKIVMSRLAGQNETRQLLVAAQKAWLVFRDRECDFVGSSSIGGSIHPMVMAQCKADLTKARTQALHHLLTCAEGDAACPLPPR